MDLRHASWKELLASPAQRSHILQLYDSEEFLCSAVAEFAAEGLARGEAVQLTGTPAHLQRIEHALSGRGVEVAPAYRDRRLVAVDVDIAIAAMLPDRRVEEHIEEMVNDRVRLANGAKCTGLRWWGEITSTLHHRGEKALALDAERLGGAAATKLGATVFCSFCCDRFDAEGYGGVLEALCSVHSHVIPAEDYVRHRIAVNRAIQEVVGDIRGTLLQSLSSWKGLGCELPSSQAVLFWLREAMPEEFEAVLARARAYQAPGAGDLS